MVLWPRIVGFTLVGYLCFKKSFAYVGVPPLFVGEIMLAAFLLLKPRVAIGTWAASLLRPSPLNLFSVTLLVFISYGVWQVGRGVMSGNDIIYTLKFFVFNYYALYIFLGMWVALHAPDCVPKLIRVMAWVGGIYGLLYLVALRHVVAYMPGSGIPLFFAPGSGAVAIVGLLCFERDLRAFWVIVVVALNVLVLLAWQVRSEWLGLAVGLLCWGLLTGRLSRVLAVGLAGVAVLGLIELADINLLTRTGGGVSLSETVARAIAPIDLELARKLSPVANHHAGTAEWRELWWEQIWISVHSTPMLEAFGHGYGFDLFGLAPTEVRAGQEDWEVRTPHSVFYYALGYTGWVGVALFSLLQFAIVRLLWRSHRIGGEPAGLVFWATCMAMAFFEASFDTPFKAIPFYLLVGMTIIPGLQGRAVAAARPERAQLAPGAGV
jgi:hypothetical protein